MNSLYTWDPFIRLHYGVCLDPEFFVIDPHLFHPGLYPVLCPLPDGPHTFLVSLYPGFPLFLIGIPLGLHLFLTGFHFFLVSFHFSQKTFYHLFHLHNMQYNYPVQSSVQ